MNPFSSYKAVSKLGVMAVLGALTLLPACSPVNFSAVQDKPKNPNIDAVTDPGDTCTSENVEAIYRETKLIFVVDTSGSNAGTTNYTGSLCGTQTYCSVPATDPQKSFRGGVISDFLERYRHKTNFDWSFLTFSGSSAQALINFGGNTQAPRISSNPNDMRYALDDFYSVTDFGKTPYRAAISLAANAIAQDPDLHSASKPNYYVILLTDGFPTDYSDANGLFMYNQMNSDISALLGIAAGRVNLSTIFYGPVADPSAIDLLKRIAIMGGGQFANVKDPNSGFRIDDVIPGSNQGCL